ncbi:MAG: hypothetical protein O8C66_11695 [Candidatus Methanoperedens sp.]|nr:hypothetical protein [Candidatus Methanoperedens sp.]MCZ7371165.1 hypothetical protein [Candidatus Methanoperedens sp.]
MHKRQLKSLGKTAALAVSMYSYPLQQPLAAMLPRVHKRLPMLPPQFPGKRRALDELGAGDHD